jgi:catechol 2,3-dioxygenase-like lactoylglutathione lyase family enzyme
VIDGSHVVLFSQDAEADRAFFADVLGLAHVDTGGGWLIFALPPTEAAFHPTDGPALHELYLTCDDIESTMSELREKGVQFTGGITEEQWGRVTRVRLPGGGDLGLYEPRHARPEAM